MIFIVYFRFLNFNIILTKSLPYNREIIYSISPYLKSIIYIDFFNSLCNSSNLYKLQQDYYIFWQNTGSEIFIFVLPIRPNPFNNLLLHVSNPSFFFKLFKRGVNLFSNNSNNVKFYSFFDDLNDSITFLS